MRFSPSFGVPALAAILALAGSIAAGCSSATSGTAPRDAGVTSSADSGVAEGDAGPAVGAACSTNGDCPAGAACSNTVYTAGNPIYPTAICVAACTPATSATQGVAACGPASVPGAGLCQPPAGSDQQGLCLPYCEVTPSGTVIGCQADDVCQLLGANPPDGAGWCQPGCTTTSQCPSGSVCDPLLAACVAAPLVATLPIGAPCSLTANPPPCNCVGTQTAAEGYCTAACVTGVSHCPSPPADGGAGAAPDGGDAGALATGTPWVCSAGLNLVTDNDGGAIFTTQPPGLFGFCAPPCHTNADCASFQGHCSQGDPAAPTGFSGTCVTGS